MRAQVDGGWGVHELLPTAAAYLAAWGAVAAGAVAAARVVAPVIRSIRAAVTLVNEQLAPNAGESLVDRVEEARAAAVQANARIERHVLQHHGGWREGRATMTMGYRWVVAVVTVLVCIAIAAAMVLAAVHDTLDSVEASQECIVRLLLIEPHEREGLAVSDILEACPGALPEVDG